MLEQCFAAKTMLWCPIGRIYPSDIMAGLVRSRSQAHRCADLSDRRGQMKQSRLCLGHADCWILNWKWPCLSVRSERFRAFCNFTTGGAYSLQVLEMNRAGRFEFRKLKIICLVSSLWTIGRLATSRNGSMCPLVPFLRKISRQLFLLGLWQWRLWPLFESHQFPWIRLHFPTWMIITRRCKFHKLRNTCTCFFL